MKVLLSVAMVGAAGLVGCKTEVVAPPAQTTVVHEREAPAKEVVVPSDKPAVQNNIHVDR